MTLHGLVLSTIFCAVLQYVKRKIQVLGDRNDRCKVVGSVVELEQREQTVVEVRVVWEQSYPCPPVAWLQLYNVTTCHLNSRLGGEIVENGSGMEQEGWTECV
jgi:hypothetical protein